MRTLILAATLAVAGCGVINGTGRCDFRTKEQRCQEREGLPTTLAALEQLCKPSGGSYASGACPREGVVGGCDLSELGNPVRDWYYPDPARNVTSADHVRAKCGTKPFLSP